MANSDLTFRIFGKDVSAGRALKGVASTADRTGKKIGGLGASMGTAFAGIGTAAAAAGAVIAVDFAKDSITAFTEAQASASKFDDAFARFPALEGYKQKIDDLATSLSKKTRFDDDATKSSAALLAKFGLTGKELTNVIPLVQDYAAATGKDLGTASGAVGKAMLGNVKALKELGINYKPTGDKAKDLANISQLLRDKVGGFAEKEGKTAAGTSAILANQFGEVQEQVGSYLVPALTTLGRWIVDTVIPAVQTLAGWLGEHLGPIFATVGAWISGTFVPAVQGLAAAFMETVWPAIQQVAAMVAENLKPAWDAFVNMWQNDLLPAIQRAWPFFQKVITVLGGIVAAVAIVVSWLIGKLYPVIGRIVGVVVGVASRVGEAISTIIDHFGDIVDFVKNIPGKIGSFLSGVADVIKAPFRTAFNGIASLWNNTVGALSFTAPDWIPGIGGKGWDVPNIPMMANGGIVTRPTLALIGEAGPEAVVPLGRAGMGQTINVYVTQPLGRPQDIARAVAAATSRAGRNGAVA